MIRTKGEAGTGNISQAIEHYKSITRDIEDLTDSIDKQIKYAEETPNINVINKTEIKINRELLI